MGKDQVKDNPLIDLEQEEEIIEAQNELDPMDERLLQDIPDEEITDEDISDENLLEGMGDNTILLDAVKQYLKSIGQFPLLSHEEQLALARRIQHGDLEARNKLVTHNLRLVVLVAKKLLKHARTLELLDLIQEGNLGLMKAADLYKPDLNYRFSTYAYRAIYSHIQRAIDEKDYAMRIPSWLRERHSDYIKFQKEYVDKYGVEPPKKVVMEKYNINETTYKALVGLDKNVKNIRSLDDKVSAESEKDTDTLENFIPDVERGYDNLNVEFDRRLFMHKLREVLTPFEYFIIYYRMLTDEPRTLEQLGALLGVTRERVRQYEKKATNKAKLIFYGRRYNTDGVSIKQIMSEEFIPANIEDIIILIVLKEKLSDYAYFLFYYVWFKKVPANLVANRLGIKESAVRNRVNHIISNYTNLLTDKNVVQEKLLELTKKDGIAKTYNRITLLEPDFNPVEETEKIVKNINYQEAREMVGDAYDKEFSDIQRKLFDRYFDRSIRTISPSVLAGTTMKIDAINSHYLESPFLDKKILYQVMLVNEEKYSPQIIDYLKKTYFKEESGYKGPVPPRISITVPYYLNLFERLYYDLENYFDYSVPKEDVERIVFGTKYRFTDEEKKLMTLRYGLGNTRVHTLKEMAEMYGLKYETMHDRCYNINLRIIDIYVGCHVMNNYSNPQRYAKYINDKRYVMTKEARKAARLYFLEGKNYKEIVEIMGIKDTTRVSNMLTDAARKMDFWEYGMVDFVLFEPDLVEKVLDHYDYSPLERQIIRLRANEGILSDMDNYIDTQGINVGTLLVRFTSNYIYLNGKDRVTMKDWEYQVKCPICDSLLTDERRQIVSLVFGIKCEYNPEGIKMTKMNIARKLGYSADEFWNIIDRIKHDMYGNKVGLVNKPFAEYTRSEVKKLLRDPHLPISDYERELLIAIKGLDGKYYTLDELSEKYGHTPHSIARRIKRAMLTMKKYEAGEIDKKLIYEIDIEPMLKYFGEYHRKIINLRYRDNVLIKDLAKKMGVSGDSMQSIFARIERKLLYLLKNPNAKKFDYDYAREVIHKPDLPFYGNFDVAYKYYLRMSGEDGEKPGGASTIDEEEVLEQKSNASIHYYMLMTAVLKYRDGIRKVPEIDVDDLEEFYQTHKNNYSVWDRKTFENVINRLRGKYAVFGKRSYSFFVISEYAKAKGNATFSFDNMTRDNAKKFIRENPYHLPKLDLENVRNRFGITNFEMMSGKDQFKVLKMMTPIVLNAQQKKKEIMEEEKKKGIADASKYKVIEEQKGFPSINAMDLAKILQVMEQGEKGVLITSPILSLIYAHIRAKHDNIEVLTMEDIYAYIYELEKAVLQEGDANNYYNFFRRTLCSSDFRDIIKENPRVGAFFKKLFTNPKNGDMLKYDYRKTDLASILPQYAANNFRAFKNRVMNANVSFVDDIPNKLYSIINFGDEIDGTEPDVAKEIINEYKDYLVNGGNLIGYFRDDEFIPEVFDGEQYQVIDVRRPKVGISSGVKTVSDKVVVMKKTII